MNSFSKGKILVNNDKKMNNVSSPKYINHNDFIYFKNDILKDLKIIETKIMLKMDTSKKEFEKKIINIEKEFNSYKSKMMIDNIDKTYSEKINNLFLFKTNIEDTLSNQEKRINKLNDYIRETINSMNRIITDTIALPDFIREDSKFTSFQNLIDYIVTNIDLLNEFKEKITVLDMQNYKIQLDTLIQNYQFQIDNYINLSKKLTTEAIKNFDNKVNVFFKTFEDKLTGVKNELERRINNINKDLIQQKFTINNNKTELINNINKIISENNHNLNNIEKKFEKTNNDMENINKKIEDMNEKIKKIVIDLDERMKSYEYKLIVKMSHLYTVMKDFNMELNRRFKSLILNSDGIQYTSFDLEKLIDESLNKIKNCEPEIPHIQLKSSHSVGSILKRYIDGEIGLNEFFNVTRAKKLKKKNRINSNYHNSNDLDNKNQNIISNITNNINNNINNNSYNINNIALKNNKIKDNINNNNDNSFYFQNVKHIKLDNKDELVKNNQEKFINRKKIEQYIVENENIILNKVPRKEIIRSLLKGNIDNPFSFYLMKNKYDKTIPTTKLNINSQTTRIKTNYLLKDKPETFLLSDKRLYNNSSYDFNKNKQKFTINTGEGNKYRYNEDINNFHKKYKRNYSSLNKKTRNNEQNSLVYNNTDIIKDKIKNIKNSSIKPKNDINNYFKKDKANKILNYSTGKIKDINPKTNIHFFNKLNVLNKSIIPNVHK